MSLLRQQPKSRTLPVQNRIFFEAQRCTLAVIFFYSTAGFQLWQNQLVPLGWSCPAACSWCRILPASSNGQWIQSPQILPDLGQRSPAVATKTMEGKGREQRNKKNTSIRGYAVSPRAEEDSTAVSSGRNTSHTHRNGVQRPLRAGGGRLPSSPPAR